jgi:UDP-N-acetylglucosamine 1-carboxyvinyltransferase
MSKFIIEGGHKLNGTITAGGNKNAAIKLLPACVLTDQPVILHNIPNIADVRVALKILRYLGAKVTDLGGNSWRIHCENIQQTELSAELASKTRASFVFSGPMLARLGVVRLPIPGGDIIGGRPLDTHVQGLKALGATVDLGRDGMFTMSADPLIGGGTILQPETSVTATENTLMAAVLAKGDTVIDNAASEPHVQDLCRFLVQLGANIEGIGTNQLRISGVDSLAGGEFTIGPDFMEVGSFIGAAAVTGGEIRIKNAGISNMRMVRLVYERLGVIWEEEGDDIIVPANQPLAIQAGLAGRIPEIKPTPWPGFPPDLMSIAVVIATQSNGSVLLHDWMYESRFFFVDKLVFMGARIVLCDPHRVLIQGKANLYADPNGVTSPDIRAGMAMLLAALCADGVSSIDNIHQIDRGYADIENKLRRLGANIQRTG